RACGSSADARLWVIECRKVFDLATRIAPARAPVSWSVGWRRAFRGDRLRGPRPGAAVGLEQALGRSREAGEPICRAPWTGNQLSAAIRAPAFEQLLGAAGAERAFERADARLKRVGRQVDVAAFAVRSQLEHRVRPPHSGAMTVSSGFR